MTVSPGNLAVFFLFLTVAFLLTQGSVAAQESDNKRMPPGVTVGPAPVSTGPKTKNENLGAPKTIAQPRSRPRALQLRLDPVSGRPLTAEQIEERVKRRKAQPPRSLRVQQRNLRPTASPTKAQSTTEKSKAKGEASGIQIQTLGRAKVSVIGLLSEAEGGLGDDMWAGTPLALVLNLLPRLPVEVASPVMQSLRLRLLVSTAIPPEDNPGSDSAPALDPDGKALVAARIERLAAAGDLDAVNQLLKFKPLTIENQAYAQVRVRSELLNGNLHEVCRMTRNHLGGRQGVGVGVMWQKIMAFCLVLDRQDAQVELYRQILYESEVEDEAFFNLLSGLSNGEIEPLERLARTEPLHLAMLRTARRVIPDGALEAASPSVLRSIATSPNASLSLRLEAAERAEAIGALKTEVLRRIYASVPVSAEQGADASALADRQPGPSASAILYQVVQIDDQIEGRARALSAAWRNGRHSGRYMTAVRVNLPQVRTIRPSAELAWFAADAGRALLAAGDSVGARAWLMAMVPLARDGQTDAAAAVLALAPLLNLNVSEGRDTVLASIIGKVLENWWQGEVANNGAHRYQRATRLYTVLSALGHGVPAKLWLPLYEVPGGDPQQGHTALLIGLELAAAASRRGEVVLLSLLLLGDRGPGWSDTITLGRIVLALRQVGLERDAAAVAFEGLLAAGF